MGCLCLVGAFLYSNLSPWFVILGLLCNIQPCMIGSTISENEYSATSDMNSTLNQVKELAELLLLLLQKSNDFDQGYCLIPIDFLISLTDVFSSSKIHKITDISAHKVKDYILAASTIMSLLYAVSYSSS